MKDAKIAVKQNKPVAKIFKLLGSLRPINSDKFKIIPISIKFSGLVITVRNGTTAAKVKISDMLANKININKRKNCIFLFDDNCLQISIRIDKFSKE